MVAQKPKINKNEPGDTQKEDEAGRPTRVSRSNFHHIMCTLRLRICKRIDKAYFRFCRISPPSRAGMPRAEISYMVRNSRPLEHSTFLKTTRDRQ